MQVLCIWTSHTVSEGHMGDAAEAEDVWYRVLCSSLKDGGE